MKCRTMGGSILNSTKTQKIGQRLSVIIKVSFIIRKFVENECWHTDDIRLGSHCSDVGEFQTEIDMNILFMEIIFDF